MNNKGFIPQRIAKNILLDKGKEANHRNVSRFAVHTQSNKAEGYSSALSSLTGITGPTPIGRTIVSSMKIRRTHA